jgi:hypothetical protein
MARQRFRAGWCRLARIPHRDATRATTSASEAVKATRAVRNFGEYAFLEDSRYMSQQKNAAAAIGVT